MKYKPNKVLPRGSRLLPKPMKKKIGLWREMEFDATGTYFGVRWFRVKGGFGGGNNPREDWVADIPAPCISVSDYHWNGNDFGANHGSFIGAIKAEMVRGLDRVVDDRKEAFSEYTALTKSEDIIRDSVAKATAPSKS